MLSFFFFFLSLFFSLFLLRYNYVTTTKLYEIDLKDDRSFGSDTIYSRKAKRCTRCVSFARQWNSGQAHPSSWEGGGREGERWVTRQRFPKFQSRLARRVAGKSLALNPPLALIERFSDSSSNPESGPNSPPTVNNSQASPTAGGNAAAIQEVSVPTSDGDAKKESLTRSLIPILVDPLFLFFFSFFLSLFFVFRS